MQLSLADLFGSGTGQVRVQAEPRVEVTAEPPVVPAPPAPEPPPPAAALTAELEAALLRELRNNYDWENQVRFRKRLKPPVLALSDVSGRWGRWVGPTRTIELSRTLVLERSWPEVLGVLLHEMAHQFVDEVLGASHEASHGEVFQQVCAERGIDGRAAGPPVPQAEPAGEVDRVLERIRKLLALAGSSNQHEAEMAMRKAHELMLRHNIEVTRARAVDAYEVAHLGDPQKRGNRVEDAVMSLLLEFFFVKVIRIPVYLPTLGTHGKVFEISGSRANLEMARHVYEFLLGTAERLWQQNRSDTRVQSGRDRLAYQAGVIRGFHDKLQSERVELKSTGLVWVGDGQLEEFYRARHPRITSRRSTVRLTGAHAAGREAGRSIVLHKPIEHGPAGGGRKLLHG
jgi:hypothetical protein